MDASDYKEIRQLFDDSSISLPDGPVREGEVYPIKELVVRNQFLEELVAEQTIQLSEANDDLRPPVGGTETILLIEDDTMVRQLIKDVLNCNGYNVIEAEDGEDGVGKYKLHRDEIRLILTDVMMPKKNGKEAYDEIRQITGDIKAIFMSGYAAVTTKKILEEGLDFLAKPVTPRVLLAKIREVLNS